jgi:hypothetical protein
LYGLLQHDLASLRPAEASCGWLDSAARSAASLQQWKITTQRLVSGMDGDGKGTRRSSGFGAQHSPVDHRRGTAEWQGSRRAGSGMHRLRTALSWFSFLASAAGPDVVQQSSKGVVMASCVQAWQHGTRHSWLSVEDGAGPDDDAATVLAS